MIMPAIHLASISTKLVEALGGASVIGPLLLGLYKPGHICKLSDPGQQDRYHDDPGSLRCRSAAYCPGWQSKIFENFARQWGDPYGPLSINTLV